MQKYLSSVLLGLGVVGAAAPAQAATVILNNGAPYSEVVHANSAGSGTTLNTLTKPGSILTLLSSIDGLDVGQLEGLGGVERLQNPTT